jgi:hypothetical protein
MHKQIGGNEKVRSTAIFVAKFIEQKTKVQSTVILRKFFFFLNFGSMTNMIML